MSLSAVYPSLYGLDFIKRYQGLSLEKYQDADNLWLIGYGHLIRDREYFDTPLTPQQAETIFEQMWIITSRYSANVFACR
ncbi:Phage-related lysozyme (muraminidase) [Kluyvera intermedia]|nr:hypothetical protein [Kluyvera intermedia]VDZ85835.1 Phage-related lysozyme (muraminidase) [Kluyvera intermedia]